MKYIWYTPLYTFDSCLQAEVNGDAKLEADREAAAKRSSEGGRNSVIYIYMYTHVYSMI